MTPLSAPVSVVCPPPVLGRELILEGIRTFHDLRCRAMAGETGADPFVCSMQIDALLDRLHGATTGEGL